MSQLTNDIVVEKIKAKFADSISNIEETYGMLSITLNSNVNIEVLQFLREDSELQFNFLTDVCGVHYPDSQQLAVVYHVHSFVKNVRIRLKFLLPVEHPVIRTASTLFASANWQERETYDFFGIIFEGHPDLRRILNVDEMEVFPLRKEYPLEDPNRVDKKDYFFGR